MTWEPDNSAETSAATTTETITESELLWRLWLRVQELEAAVGHLMDRLGDKQ